MRLVAALTAIALGLGTGCGTRQVLLDASGARVSPAASVLSGAATGASETPEASGRTPPALRFDGAGGTPKAFPSGLAAHSTIPLEVTLDRTCARPADGMAATAKTVPNASLTFAVAYPDNSRPPDYYFIPRDANTTGTFTWRWLIPPTMKRGDALLVVVAAKGGRQGATYNAPFRIADAC